ncbi:MAG: DHHW family protein [Bacilli bacterium]|nr:DHHW family protein [Bacilli bacterium]MDD4808486.1 DHHW family protein [Bacilli bacterium]
MKKRYNKIIAVALSLFVVLSTCLFLFSEKQIFSENENRYFQPFPKLTFNSLKKGEYTAKLQNYVADHFYNRNQFMNIKTNYEKLIGKKDIGGVYLAQDNYLIEKYERPLNSDAIIKSLNNFYHSLNYINMNLMLVPTSITINQDKLPKLVKPFNQLDHMNYIYRHIKFNTIDVSQTLIDNNQNYQMFYYLDHHWTTYAAYFSYLELMKQNLMEPIPLTDFEIKEVSSDFKGTLYSKSNDYNRNPDKIHLFLYDKYNYQVNYVSSKIIKDSFYEMEHLKKKDKYAAFLDNNHPLIVITNQNIKTNLEIVIIKDSYANNFIPFVANHFKKVHVIDPRFYKLSITDYIKENKNIKDVLFLYNLNTIDSDNGIVTIN